MSFTAAVSLAAIACRSTYSAMTRVGSRCSLGVVERRPSVPRQSWGRKTRNAMLEPASSNSLFASRFVSAPIILYPTAHKCAIPM